MWYMYPHVEVAKKSKRLSPWRPPDMMWYAYTLAVYITMWYVYTLAVYHTMWYVYTLAVYHTMWYVYTFAVYL